MSIIYLLLTLSVIVALVFFVAFILSVRQGQYDDTYTPSIRMLFEDEIIAEKRTEQTKESNHLNDQLK
ncbi:cbb3-type cytochrome oxidase assembly protein CcoS [Spongiimicrobium salis]|uniref:cbb3-type cytochrome oxidase assembly protein CcoS n=1 Tax=Spongiimicrobium salis TaxID=1667022 RepID=UPI00374DD38F